MSYGGPTDNLNGDAPGGVYTPTALIPSKRAAQIEAETGLDVVARRKETILRYLAEGWSVRHACEQAGVTTWTNRYYREQDQQYDEACAEAIEMGTDALEDVALKRARFGVDKPVFYQGEECGSIREYSDTLLIFLLKSRRPEKYVERVRNTHENADGSPVNFTFNVGGGGSDAVARSREAEDAKVIDQPIAPKLP